MRNLVICNVRNPGRRTADGCSSAETEAVEAYLESCFSRGFRAPELTRKIRRARFFLSLWIALCRRTDAGVGQLQGLQQIFEEHRRDLLRYLRAHGAEDRAEDLLQELWLKFVQAPAGPIASPKNYLYRAATNLMIDVRRSERQALRRELEWSDLSDRMPHSAANEAGPERELDGRRRLAMVEAELARLPQRALSIFRQHRIEGRTQREIAASMALSASTIESDLRMVYRLLDELRRKLDEEN